MINSTIGISYADGNADKDSIQSSHPHLWDINEGTEDGSGRDTTPGVGNYTNAVDDLVKLEFVGWGIDHYDTDAKDAGEE